MRWLLQLALLRQIIMQWNIHVLSHPWLLSEISFSSKNRKSEARMDSEPGLGNVFGTLSGWLKLTEAATIFISLILHRCV